MKNDCNVRNENGYVLIGSLLMLGLLSFLGISSTTTSTMEQQIAGNSKAYSECFYVAEGSAIEAVQMLRNASVETLEDRSEVWLNAEATIENMANWEDPSYWDADGEDGDDNATVASLNPSSVQLAYTAPVHTAVDFGVAGGSSLSMTESSVHAFSTYGMCDSGSEILIEVGYRRRY